MRDTSPVTTVKVVGTVWCVYATKVVPLAYTPAKKYCNLLVSTKNSWSILINTILFVDFHGLPLASKKLHFIISDL